MSFSADVKGELARTENKKQCCKLAEIAGFLRVSSFIRLAGGGRFGIVAKTENAATARHYKKLIKDYFRSNAVLEVGESQMPGTSRKRGRNKYYLSISPDRKSMQILRETGMVLIREGDDYFSDGIYQPIVKSKCCRKAYLRGMFLSISKSLHGDVQRMINCDNANVDRTLSAAEEQRGWIRTIAESELGRPGTPEEISNAGSLFWTDGLRHLPGQLKEVAFLRLYKPEASLAEIGETLNPPIGKPAVSKRFARIKALAENIDADRSS